MAIGTKDSNCLSCGLFLKGVNVLTKYCDACNASLKRSRIEACRIKSKNKKNERIIIEFERVFADLTSDIPYNITPKGFNQASKTKVKSYVQVFDCRWIDLVHRYNKFDELFNYILKEYLHYIQLTSKQNLHTFANTHEYINYDLLMDVGIDSIMEAANVAKKRHSDQILIDNFEEIKRLSGRVPLYNDFEKYSKIPQMTYANRFGLKGKIYDNIVKNLVTEEEFIDYLKAKNEHKSSVGKVTGSMSTIYSLHDLETEFRRVFNYFIMNHGCNPPRRVFNKFSRIDDKTYRKRLQKSWSDVCVGYGYQIEKEANNSEKIVLQTISKLLGTSYIPQKTWGWLIGSGGKHMYCDGYFEDINLVVEFDGKQHRKPVMAFGGTEAFLRLQKNDALKEKLLQQEGIRLIRIDSRMPWHDVDYLIRLLTHNGFKSVTQDAEFFITSPSMQCASI